MKTNVLVTMALVTGMMLAGCSKNESSEDTRKGNNMEQKLTKEQIVGVWRSGDYWVSFSESGYNSAYFPIENDERIDEGTYTIDGDTITVASQLYYSWTKYIIRNISSTSINLTIVYNFYGSTRTQGDNYEVSKDILLTKGNDAPCIMDDGLDGKTFTCESIFYNYKNHNTYEVTQFCTFWSEYHLIRFQNHFKSEEEDKIDGNHLSGGRKYYVYLSPYIYTIDLKNDTYKRNTKTTRGELSFNSDGSINYTPVN